MKDEATYIKETITTLKGQIAQIPSQFAKLKRATDAQIDALCEKAGIMDDVERLRDNLTAQQKKLQAQADFIGGKVKALEELHYHYHYAPIPEGVTHMYGIELEPLDPETRLRVMGGDAEVDGWVETITTLGGDPDRKNWDGTEDPVEVTTRLVPPSTSYIVEPDGGYEEEAEEEADDTDDPFFMDEDTGEQDPNLEAIRNMMQK